MSDLKASNLSLCRLLDPTDGLMFSTSWEDRTFREPLKVRAKSVRGTMGHALSAKDKKKDPQKLAKDLASPNPQTIDIVTLPFEHDTLVVQWNLRLPEALGTLSACNEPAVEARLKEMIQQYLDSGRLEDLCRRYAHNIANARWLWRNGMAEEIEVVVHRKQQGARTKTWTFDSLELDLQVFDNYSDGVKSLGALFAEGLQGRDGYHLYEVCAYVRLGNGCEVYPSQNLTTAKNPGHGKFLYHVGDQAAMTSQKIGNAIRTIDTWHGHEGVGAIAVEPYGAVTAKGAVYRFGKSLNFYGLLQKWLKGKDLSVTDQDFVMAVLIRGGVFGEKG